MPANSSQLEGSFQFVHVHPFLCVLTRSVVHTGLESFSLPLGGLEVLSGYNITLWTGNSNVLCKAYYQTRWSLVLRTSTYEFRERRLRSSGSSFAIHLCQVLLWGQLHHSNYRRRETVPNFNDQGADDCHSYSVMDMTLKWLLPLFIFCVTYGYHVIESTDWTSYMVPSLVSSWPVDLEASLLCTEVQ